MNAVLKPDLRLAPITETMLEAVLRIEKNAYAHPWTRGNFADAIKSGYQLMALMGGNTWVGYWVAMEGVDEVHLLNITVAPAFQGNGYSVMMLDALSVWARSRHAQWLWLEVRLSNTRAMQVYERYGFRAVGERKNYYPAGQGQREHAVVMSLKL
jgi:ribosomal-protein-alanine N-acetyltransferase